MATEQMLLPLDAPSPAAPAARFWAFDTAVPADLLAEVWEKVREVAMGKPWVRIDAGDNDYFEIHPYPSGGWAINAHGNGSGSYGGSCMSKVALCKMLRKFLRRWKATGKTTLWDAAAQRRRLLAGGDADTDTDP